MSKIIVELSVNNSKNIEKYSFNKYPVSIGRGYQNDIILSDPYVCSNHLDILEKEDGFILKDNASENGIFINNKRMEDNEISVSSGSKIKIGNSVLQIFSENHEIKPSLKFDFWSTTCGKFLFAGIVITSSILLLLLLALDEYLDSYIKIRLSELFNEANKTMFVILFGSGLCGLIGFLIKHKANFLKHLLITNIFFYILIISNACFSHLSYALNYNAIQFYFSGFFASILMAILLYFNFKYALSTIMSKKKQICLAILITIILSSFVMIGDYADKKTFSESPEFKIILKPPAFKFVSGKSIDKFLGDSHIVFEFDKDELK